LSLFLFLPQVSSESLNMSSTYHGLKVNKQGHVKVEKTDT
jgi:hypothetical protein